MVLYAIADRDARIGSERYTTLLEADKNRDISTDYILAFEDGRPRELTNEEEMFLYFKI